MWLLRAVWKMGRERGGERGRGHSHSRSLSNIYHIFIDTKISVKCFFCFQFIFSISGIIYDIQVLCIILSSSCIKLFRPSKKGRRTTKLAQGRSRRNLPEKECKGAKEILYARTGTKRPNGGEKPRMIQ